MSATVLGIGTFLPGPSLSNRDLETLAGPLPPELESQIGVHSRHWMVDPVEGKAGCNTSDMATAAALRALNVAQVGLKEVDLLIISSSSPDYLLPPLSSIVHDKLGLRPCAAFDIRAGCSGAVLGLHMALAMVESGEAHVALVIGAEAISPLLVPLLMALRSGRPLSLRDRLNLYAFGDAAAAVVVGQSGPARIGIRYGLTRVLGAGKKAGMWIDGGGTAGWSVGTAQTGVHPKLQVDFSASSRQIPLLLREALTYVDARDIDLVVIPEVAETPQDIAARLQGRLFGNVERVGNTGSPACLLALAEAWEKGILNPGMNVLVVGVEISKWIYSLAMFGWTLSAATQKMADQAATLSALHPLP